METLERMLFEEWKVAGSESAPTWSARAAYLEVSVNTTKKILERRGNDRSVLLHAFARLGLPWDESYAEPFPGEPAALTAPATEVESGREPTTEILGPERPRQSRRTWAPLAAVVTLLLVLALEPSSTQSRLQAPPNSPDSLGSKSSQAGALIGLARGAWARGEYTIARNLTSEAIEVARRHGLAKILADALRVEGDILAATGRLEEAVERYEQALPLWTTFDQVHGWGTLLEALGVAKARLGRLDEAERHLTESLAVLERAGMAESAAGTMRGLGSLAAVRGDFSLAREWYDRASAAIAHEPDEPMHLDLQALGALLLRDEGRFVEALESLSACRAGWERHGSRRWVATTDHQIGTVHAAAGDGRSAREAWERARRGYEAVGDAKGVAECEAWLAGRLHLGSGPTSRAEQFF